MTSRSGAELHQGRIEDDSAGSRVGTSTTGHLVRSRDQWEPLEDVDLVL